MAIVAGVDFGTLSVRVTLLDSEPVMPIGVVTTQPDRSPMFGIERR